MTDNQHLFVEIQQLQNELTQQLGVSAHNLSVSQYFVTARNVVSFGQAAAAIDNAMNELRAKIAEIRVMPRMERAALGMPKRVAPLPPPEPKTGIKELEAEVKALGGALAVAPDGMNVQLIGCALADLSADARWAVRARGAAFAGILQRRTGI